MQSMSFGIMGAGLLALLSACATEDSLPRERLGALPFPGILTLYTASQISELGPHRYEGWLERPFEASEGARGIMYTCRAGFLDLAHVREGIDWTRCAWKHVGPLLAAGGGSWTFEHEGNRFELQLSSPACLADLDIAQRESVIDDASLRIAQRVAYDVMTWHEIATWYGWSMIPFVSEEGSSFTCEDSTSNLIGVTIGGRVLRDGDGDFDNRATEALRVMVVDLGAVSDPMVDAAARSVEGIWWKDGVAVRRDLETCTEEAFKTPWLVPHLDCCAGTSTALIAMPSLREVGGMDLSDAYTLRIAPPRWLLERVQGRPSSMGRSLASKDFPALIDQIREQMTARWGADVGSPFISSRMTSTR